MSFSFEWRIPYAKYASTATVIQIANVVKVVFDKSFMMYRQAKIDKPGIR